VHVAPRWESTPIAAVRFSDVQAWVSDLKARKGATVVRRAFRVLSGILTDAARDRLLASNPAAGAKLPRETGRKHLYLTAEQLQRLADEADQGVNRYGALVLLLGVGGLRFGEAAALRVRHLDFLHRRITLTENAVTVAGRIEMGSLKTGKSRTVYLPAFVFEALSTVCAGKDRDALLWSKGDGSPLSPPSPSSSWLAFSVRRCMAADPTFPRITAHALRHTAASLAIHSGANPLVVQRMLGHSSAAMTLDTYADLFESDVATVAENVGKLCASATG
jgi:integrase